MCKWTLLKGAAVTKRTVQRITEQNSVLFLDLGDLAVLYSCMNRIAWKISGQCTNKMRLTVPVVAFAAWQGDGAESASCQGITPIFYSIEIQRIYIRSLDFVRYTYYIFSI